MQNQTGKDAIEVFEEAMNNIMPVLEVKARRIGGATYQVPIEVRPERRQAFRSSLDYMYYSSENAVKRQWKNDLARRNHGCCITIQVHHVKKKEDMHKMAEANKAFAHYRF